MQWPDYSRFTETIAEGVGPEIAFAALRDLTQEAVGAKLFTVTTVDPSTGMFTRVYTNMPEAYPTSGTKPPDVTDWSRRVIMERQTFVANDIESIAEVFPDHELIKSLGCESVINVPVAVGGQVIGTINCLHEAGFYTEERVKASEALKLPGAVCLLLNELVAKGSA
jgi:GAF domain-containing protein